MPEYGVGAHGSATDIPLGKIQELKASGLSNNQIIQQLQRQGFMSTQIFDALSQAAVQPASSPAAQPLGLPSRPAPTQPLNTPPPVRGRMDAPPAFGAPPPSFGGTDSEEMIEAIIDEKWNDLMVDINKVIAWKEATEARITKLEQQMADLKDSFDKLQGAVVGKVGEYDQHILEVGAEVKAMEKVFSKVLPVFTDNVAELSRVAEQMKRNVPQSSSINLRK